MDSEIDKNISEEESRHEERERTVVLQAERINQLQRVQEEERIERMRLEEQLREKEKQIQADSQKNNQGSTKVDTMAQALKKVIEQVQNLSVATGQIQQCHQFQEQQ